MEDFELMRRLRKQGKIAIAPAAVITSGRRWQKLGLWRTTLINQGMVLGFFQGATPTVWPSGIAVKSSPILLRPLPRHDLPLARLQRPRLDRRLAR